MAIQFIKGVIVNGDLTATRLIKIDGTSSQFLKADGSVDSTGYLSSVGLTMPVAFSVANSPLTANGTLEVTAIGTASQYIRGDGQLATLPASGGGGGSSVFYYLNGSVAASVATYKQMGNTPVIGGGTDFNLVGNGLIAQFLTDIGNPNRIQIPGGAWNFEMFFNMSSVGGNTKFYVELLKYNGATFTSIASNITVPEEITGGTSVDLYLTSIAVPETVLLTTDRLAIRVYIIDNSGGRTATLHTEDNTLCQVTTTFSAGVTSINGLTENTQYLAVGTDGADFNISSLLDTHTFNLPTASSTKRGALSIGDWTAFNNKANASGTINYISKFTGASSLGNSIVYDDGTKVGIGTISPMYKLDVNGDISLSIGSYYKVGGTNLVNDSQYIPKATTLGYFVNSLIYDNGTNIGIGTTAPTQQLTTTGDAIIRNAYIGYIPAFGVNYASFSHASRNNANDYSLLSENNGTTYLNASLVQSIKFRIGNFDKAIIDSNGNFGIGTTSPNRKLTVAGEISSNYGSNQGALWLGDIALQQGSFTSYGILDYTLHNGGGYSQIMRIQGNGNVGIGTTSPAYKLDVNGSSRVQGNLYLNGNIEYNGLVGSDFYISTIQGGGIVYQADQNGHRFQTYLGAWIDRLIITDGGNVGIGTTSPAYKLDVIGNLRLLVNNEAVRFQSVDSNGNYITMHNGSGGYGYIGSNFHLIGGGSASDLGIRGESNLVFSSGGAVERMRITSGGNVGIGTTSPIAKLQAEIASSTGASGVDGIRFSNGLMALNFGVEATNNYSWIQSSLGGTGSKNLLLNPYGGNVGIGTTSPSAKLDVRGTSDTTDSTLQIVGNATSTLLLGQNSSGGVIRGQGGSNALAFWTGGVGDVAAGGSGSERMRITSGGNVGIGTTSPSVALDFGNVTGKAFHLYTSGLDYYGLNMAQYDGGGFSTNIFSGNGGDVKIRTASGTSTQSTRMIITSTGNVGIGTTSPNRKLEIVSTDSEQLVLTSTSTSNLAGIFLNPANTTFSSFIGGTGNDIVMNTVGAEKMRITAAGNVGIGTTSPAYKLQVVNSGNTLLQLNGNNTAGTIDTGFTISADDSKNIFLYQRENASTIFGTNNAERMRITPAGNVGIGTTNPTAKLHVVGMVEYATNALAIAGGLTVGAFYHTGGVVKVVI
jgi:hypothetical protein